jgi:integrase
LKIIEAYFQGRRLASMSPADILQFKKDREAILKADGTPRTNASANRELACLRSLLNCAVFPYEMLEVSPFKKFMQQWTKSNPKLRLFREEPTRNRVLKPVEIPNIFEHSRPFLQNIIKGLLLTGLRVRDLLNLRWEDIDYQEQTFRFTEKKKNDKEGTKPLTDDFVALLSSIRRTPDDGGYIFVGHRGKPIKNPPKSFGRMKKKAGIKDLKMRDLRRSSATALLNTHTPLPAIQKHLSHSKIGTTMIYLHVDEEDMRKETSKLGDYFFQPRQNLGHQPGTNRAQEEFNSTSVAGNA